MKQNGSKKRKRLRPTAGRVREALFDILRTEIQDASFLDLYAGTGAVGIDALKEGAARAVFVEESRGSAAGIRALAQKSGLSERTKVVTRKALSFIERAELDRETFDVIFMDPPYHCDEITRALSAVGGSGILRRGGILVAEHFSKAALPDEFGRLQKVRDYRYGDTVLSVYRG